MAKLIKWFTTRNGILFTRCCVGLSAVGAFSGHIAVHGPFLEKFKNIVQLYSPDGSEKPLADSVKDLIIKVVDESDATDKEKNRLKFFSFIGHDLFHAGGKNSHWGGIIGVPFNFDDKFDVGKLRLAGRDSDKNWIIEDPEVLLSVSLSENAKKFGLMREIYACDIQPVLQNAAIATLCIIFPAQLARYTNLKLDTFENFTFKRRSFQYFLFYFCGWAIYRCLKDPLGHFFAKNCDEKAAKTGPGYLEGGIEYYEKLLKKNKSLRKLLPNGTWTYSADGNENYLLLAPKLPITKRLELLKKLEEKKTQ